MDLRVGVLADNIKVFEWDASSHKEAYDLWLSAVLADGGGDCKALCEMHNEPLIPGMLVGQPEHELSVLSRRKVRNLINSMKMTTHIRISA